MNVIPKDVKEEIYLRGKATKYVSWMEHNILKKENQQLQEIIGILTLEVEKSKKESPVR